MATPTRQQTTTAAEFDVLIDLPENADKILELIGGEIREVPSNPYASKISIRISGYIFNYLLQNDIGHLTGEAGGYYVMGERYAPDVAFVSYAKQDELAKKGYNPTPPDLAVEVVSTESAEENTKLVIKLQNYMAAGVVLWVVRPETQTVEVYEPGQAARILSANETLDGGALLPGFALPVKQIFGRTL